MNHGVSLRLAALLAVLLGSLGWAWGYALIGAKWRGSSITMYLQVDSWNQSAARALAEWNVYLGSIKFRSASSAPIADGNGYNNVFLSDSMYGMDFEPSTLAVTRWWRIGSQFTDADVIFNEDILWDSYSGPIQGNLIDFHRVALHEFGHVLGLDHSSNRQALMYPYISAIDSLQPDDIAGARALYGASTAPAPSPTPSGPAVAILEPSGSPIRTTRGRIAFKGTADATRVDGIYVQNLNWPQARQTTASGVARWSARVRLRLGRNRIRISYLPDGANSVRTVKTVTVVRR